MSRGQVESRTGVALHRQAHDRVAVLRRELYRCFTARADALSEVADAVLCADGPVKTLVGCRWRLSTTVGIGPGLTRLTKADRLG